MAKVYDTQTISGYNSSPPPNDGTEVSANEVAWDKHVDKLAGPVKTLSEAINDELVDSWEDLVITVETMAEMKGLAVGVIPSSQILLRGFASAGDGGEGRFRWDGSSTATDDGGTIIQRTAGGNGRFIRDYSRAINVLWFGPNTTPGTTDMTTVITSADAVGGVYFPDGTYLISDLELTNPFETGPEVFFEVDAGATYGLRVLGDVLDTNTSTPSFKINDALSQSIIIFTLKGRGWTFGRIRITGTGSTATGIEMTSDGVFACTHNVIKSLIVGGSIETCLHWNVPAPKWASNNRIEHAWLIGGTSAIKYNYNYNSAVSTDVQYFDNFINAYLETSTNLIHYIGNSITASTATTGGVRDTIIARFDNAGINDILIDELSPSTRILPSLNTWATMVISEINSGTDNNLKKAQHPDEGSDQIFGDVRLEGTAPALRLKETDGSADENMQVKLDGGSWLIQKNDDAFVTAVTLMEVTQEGSVISGEQAAFPVGSTDGYLYIPTMTGVPTGVPTAKTGKTAIVYDSANNKIMVYDGGWIGVAVA